MSTAPIPDGDTRPEGGPGTAYANILATERSSRWTALVLRLVVAYLWINNLEWKVPPDFGADDGGGLYGFTAGAVDHPVLPAYSSFVESVILPNYGLFGWLVFVTEIALGGCLLLGLGTRFWGIVGAAQSFVIYLTVAAQPHEWWWAYILMIVAHLSLVALGAGRVVGIDAWLRRRARSRPPNGAVRLLMRAT